MLSIARVRRAAAASAASRRSSFRPEALRATAAEASSPRPPRRVGRPAGERARFSSSSRADFFHGLSLDDGSKRNSTAGGSGGESDPAVREARAVETEEDKRKRRELVEELVRAEMSAHSPPAPGNATNDGDGDSAPRDGATRAPGPYERRALRLERAAERRSRLSPDDGLRYARSCAEVGDLHYGLGRVERSREILLDGLRVLAGDRPEGRAEERRMRSVEARLAHSLGAVAARCGEYDEAFRWYEESLKLKREALESPLSENESSLHRYEMGKTFNGLAALEVMSGGGRVDWEKAMTLFQDAERSYLHPYQHFAQSNDGGVPNWENIPQEMVDRMTPHLVQSVIDVRSNMGELLRQQGRHWEAVEMLRLALDLARMDVARMNPHSGNDDANNNDLDSSSNDPTPEERRNAVVDLMVKIADSHIADENYDDAAASYEKALALHVAFRKLAAGQENDQISNNVSDQMNSRMPAAASSTLEIPLDLSSATTVEAAIRNNLAHALVRIEQPKLALVQYEHSLKIKRNIGGDGHLEVGHTLMEMGALLGGPMKDLATGLNCFKEALFIYRCNLHELYESKASQSENSRLAFYDIDNEIEAMNGHIYNATKNIALIEDALLKDRDGVSKASHR